MGQLQQQGNIMERLVEGWRRHRRVREERALLLNGDAFDIERIAADVGMGADELAEVIARGEDASALSAQMMVAHGFDRDGLAARSLSSLHEIEVTCSRCEHKRRCEVELLAGTAVRHAEAFCPNSHLMQALAQELAAPGPGPA